MATTATPSDVGRYPLGPPKHGPIPLHVRLLDFFQNSGVSRPQLSDPLRPVEAEDTPADDAASADPSSRTRCDQAGRKCQVLLHRTRQPTPALGPAATPVTVPPLYELSLRQPTPALGPAATSITRTDLINDDMRQPTPALGPAATAVAGPGLPPVQRASADPSSRPRCDVPVVNQVEHAGELASADPSSRPRCDPRSTPSNWRTCCGVSRPQLSAPLRPCSYSARL